MADQTKIPPSGAQLGTELSQADAACAELMRLVAALGEQRDGLIDALVRALPFVEDAEKSEIFKPGYVSDAIAKIRAALTAAGAV